jgi:hypothetical protein
VSSKILKERNIMAKNKKREKVSKSQIDQVPPVLAMAGGEAAATDLQLGYTDIFKRFKPNPYLAYESTYLFNKRVQMVEVSLAILEVALGLRFLFELFGASFRNILAAITYVTTFFFVLPFKGIFGSDPVSGLSKNELETLAAMLIWAIGAYTAIALMKLNRKYSQNF